MTSMEYTQIERPCKKMTRYDKQKTGVVTQLQLESMKCAIYAMQFKSDLDVMRFLIGNVSACY